ncbi:GDSL esterase/lipase At5g03820-like [Rutidosis leptorrhynchoides]|uniref:GDSL esterase/lipase At5g03820-like n=1 Tax=Rutidosis leptorrhynchoides TaxID=125765 RepID=UPI003A9A0A68
MDHLNLNRCIFMSSYVFVSVIMINGYQLVPALCIFGDSVMDAGNNNYLPTFLRANFLPYGRDFVTHEPTGRFCNGKLAVDYTAEYLGFRTYPPPYLSAANGTLLLNGANFASAGSGFYHRTARLYQSITLTRQIAYYRDWQDQVVNIVGHKRTNAIFSRGIHILCAGNSDFLQHYYISPLLNRMYTPSQFSKILLNSYYAFVESLYSLGVRRIGVTTLPPVGCLPAAITLFGDKTRGCVSRFNNDAMMFNNKLNETSQRLVAQFPGLKLVIFDIYHPLLDIITNPSNNDFYESRRGCCGTGIFETSFLCNANSIGTCSNATGYVFWDGFHPSEAANRILAQTQLAQGLNLIFYNCYIYNMKWLICISVCIKLTMFFCKMFKI